MEVSTDAASLAGPQLGEGDGDALGAGRATSPIGIMFEETKVGERGMRHMGKAEASGRWAKILSEQAEMGECVLRGAFEAVGRYAQESGELPVESTRLSRRTQEAFTGRKINAR